MSFLSVLPFAGESGDKKIQHRAANLFLPAASGSPAPVLPPQIFDFTGNVQSFTVPDGVTSIDVLGWGAGGGGGFCESLARLGIGFTGACGGYGECTIAVTPGETLTVVVGGGGQTNILGTDAAGGYPDGGKGFGVGNSPNYGLQNAGGGGGSTSILRGSTPLMSIGGGGGGGSNQIPGTNLDLPENTGCGGGIAPLWIGLDGQGTNGAGGGGGGNSATFGGLAGVSIDGGGVAPYTDADPGSASLGGDGAYSTSANYAAGGGGGGGLWGGGGGGVAGLPGAGAGGGGGSTDFDASVTAENAETGTGQAPAQMLNPYYDGNGYGGAGGRNGIFYPPVVIPTNGANGRLVIDWIVP